MTTKNSKNLTNSPTLVAARPPTLSVKSKVKAAMLGVNHNETPTRQPRVIKAKTR
jgi:hypothetical protein